MTERLKTALLFQKGNFVGREYLHSMRAANRSPDVLIAVGEASDEYVARELERTGGLWNPPEIPHDDIVHSFPDTSDPELLDFVRASSIDVAIQGGVGILKGKILEAPRVGFINIHPGRLPQYRGASCPEWAVFNGDPVYATAHFIDKGIDTGPVISASRYEICPQWSYEEFRANVYRHCARVLLSAIKLLEQAGRKRAYRVAKKQPHDGACSYQPMPAENLEQVKKLFEMQSESNDVELKK